MSEPILPNGPAHKDAVQSAPTVADGVVAPVEKSKKGKKKASSGSAARKFTLDDYVFFLLPNAQGKYVAAIGKVTALFQSISGRHASQLEVDGPSTCSYISAKLWIMSAVSSYLSDVRI